MRNVKVSNDKIQMEKNAGKLSETRDKSQNRHILYMQPINVIITALLLLAFMGVPVLQAQI